MRRGCWQRRRTKNSKGAQRPQTRSISMMKCINNNPIGTRLSLERRCPSITLDRMPAAETLRAHFVLLSLLLLSLSCSFICFFNSHFIFLMCCCVYSSSFSLTFNIHFLPCDVCTRMQIVRVSVRDSMSRQSCTTFVTYNSYVWLGLHVYCLSSPGRNGRRL